MEKDQATSKNLCFCFWDRLRPATCAGVIPFRAECGRTKLKNTNMEIRLLADWKDEKPCLVLYHALNCVLKHSMRLLEMSSRKLSTRIYRTPKIDFTGTYLVCCRFHGTARAEVSSTFI